ncbi:MAG: hypothetical protein M9938_00235 [Solirubrobacterales bacterium]|nr:hypothetical protein [Solirubrobacterales bacterium]
MSPTGEPLPYAELLRSTVLLTAGGATALGALAVIGAERQFSPTLLVVGGVWWLVAAWIGLSIGGSDRSAESVREALSSARTVTARTPGVGLPSPARVAWMRLWPILAAVALAGVVGAAFPEVAVIGAGYALLVALAWRNREGAVLAVEGRDGVRFLVESGHAFRPVKLVRTPGFRAF